MSGILGRLLIVALGLVPLAEVGAQIPEIQPGARIRLRAPSQIAGRAVGVLAGGGTDSLTLVREGSAPVALALRNITVLEVSRGKSRTKGMLRGIALGGVLGLVLGASGYDEGNCDGYVCSRGEAARLGAFGGAALGAGIGAAIGVERWERVTLAVRVSAFRSTGGSLTMAVTAFQGIARM